MRLVYRIAKGSSVDQMVYHDFANIFLLYNFAYLATINQITLLNILLLKSFKVEQVAQESTVP